MTLNDFVLAYERLNLQPLDGAHRITEESRLVHDLGIAGDDFDELLQLSDQDIEEVTRKIFPKKIPEELSATAYYVSMARSPLCKYLPCLRAHYIRKIKDEPILLGEFITR